MFVNRFFIVIPFLVFLFVVTPGIAPAGQYKVVRVVNEVTLVIKYDGKYEKVRLLCVNTPESVHPDKKQAGALL